jgi:tape measure domain-containing protein
MARGDEDVVIRISAEDDATRTINSVSRSLGRLDAPATGAAKAMAPLGPSIAGIAGALGPAVITGIAGLAAGFGAAAAAGIKFNAALETNTVAFETLLGSGEAAQAFLTDLQTFAATTPFEFPELAQTSQLMLAMGFAAEDVLPLMTDIGNAVSALGGGTAEVDRVTRALGQMQAKGKVMAEDMAQITELGLPAWQMLADALGTDVATAMEKVTKEGVDATVMIEAFQKHSQETFGGAMQKQSQTFAGLWSTIKDNINLALGAITGPLFDEAKGALQTLADYVASPEFQEFADLMRDQVAVAVRVVKDAVIALTKAFSGQWEDAPGEMEPITRVFGNLGLIARDLADALGAVWSSMTEGQTPTADAEAGVSSLADALGELHGFLTDLDESITAFNSDLQPVADALNAVAGAASAAGVAIRGFLKPIFESGGTLDRWADKLEDLINLLRRIAGMKPVMGTGSGTGGGSGPWALAATPATATGGGSAGYGLVMRSREREAREQHVTINVDARGASDPAATARAAKLAVEAALARTGRRADARARMGT